MKSVSDDEYQNLRSRVLDLKRSNHLLAARIVDLEDLLERKEEILNRYRNRFAKEQDILNSSFSEDGEAEPSKDQNQKAPVIQKKKKVRTIHEPRPSGSRADSDHKADSSKVKTVQRDDNFLNLGSGFCSSSYGAVWSENELRTLVRGHRSHGKKWDKIAKMLPGRLPSTVKHRLLELKRKDPDLYRKLNRKKR
ncbi:hypothetical protein NDN08_008133 [Rhodosorus marinus]|uniref:Myb-like domain-containing protein n=1 Tax=Rhodosorus marinus TaxID=101924 RepID=A0AAV8V4F4_9RHOD|nr:hypothetical protein NDN08_008133 [Rhodosorus marinus]